MSMFKTLSRFTDGSTVHVAIFGAGEGRLRAIISQKFEDADSDKKPLSLSVTGTPEELDTELPLALAEAAAIPAKSVADQVKEQQAEAAADKNTDKPAAKTSGKTPVKKTVKTPAKKAAKAPAKAPAAKPAAPVIKPLYPEKAKAAAPKAPKGTKAPTPEALAAKRAACLIDLNDALAKHGDNLTRRIFTAEAKTGRSFETAFGSWEKFLDARAAEVNKQAVAAQASTQTAAVQVAGSEDPASVQSKTAAELIATQQQAVDPVAVVVADPVSPAPPETGTKAGTQVDLLGDPPPARTSTLQIF